MHPYLPKLCVIFVILSIPSITSQFTLYGNFIAYQICMNTKHFFFDQKTNIRRMSNKEKSDLFVWFKLVNIHAIVLNGKFSEGSVCRLHTGTKGFCKNASKCSWLIQNLQSKTMKLNDIRRCSFAVGELHTVSLSNIQSYWYVFTCSN